MEDDMAMNEAAADGAVEQAALARTDEAWLAAVRGGQIDRALSFWADDAVVLAPGVAPLVGKAAIADYVAASFQIPGFTISWVTERWTVARAGDMAYGVGTNTMTYRDAVGELVTVPGKSATVWRKDPDGWKCVLDVWNDAPRAT
jgi:ketosteroid isomerase-like protein